MFVGGTALKSREGTTQCDSLAMQVYALVTVLLIRELSSTTDAKQVWYADDFAAFGKISSTRQWWDTLTIRDPSYGYFANGNKTWLLVKESFKLAARDLYKGVYTV